ncbi:MAG TPA: VOC family protein [Candidatus Dormibacteraeota bacterium]|nr:VOC family protein [Candidatus Dormibacteraeota bacterium]
MGDRQTPPGTGVCLQRRSRSSTGPARLVELGPSLVREHQIGGGRQRWTVIQDPEGNEFCVAARSFTG